MEAAAWGFVGTLVGALASIGTSWIANRNARLLQSAKLQEDRAERAKAFQRETLIALQDSVLDALRLYARAHIELVEATRKSGQWRKAMLSEEVNQGLLAANRRVAVLVERVADESVRAKVRALVSLGSDGVLAQNEHVAEAINMRIATELQPLQEAIGVALRSNY